MVSLQAQSWNQFSCMTHRIKFKNLLYNTHVYNKNDHKESENGRWWNYPKWRSNYHFSRRWEGLATNSPRTLRYVKVPVQWQIQDFPEGWYQPQMDVVLTYYAAYFCRKLHENEKKNWTPCSPYPPMSTGQDKTSIGLVSMKKLNDLLKHGPLVKKHRPRQPLNTTSVLQTSTRECEGCSDIRKRSKSVLFICIQTTGKKSCVIQVRVFCCY